MNLIEPKAFSPFTPEYTEEIGRRLDGLDEQQIAKVAERYCVAAGINPMSQVDVATAPTLSQAITRPTSQYDYAVNAVMTTLLTWRSRYRSDRALHAAIDAVTGDE